MSHKTWVFIEQFRGAIAPAALEALGEGRRVAEALGSGVTALLFGQGVEGLAQDVIAHGADEVLLADDATLAEFRAEPYAALLAKLAVERAPEVILAAATTRGRDLLGMAAVDLDGAAFADVTAVQVAGEGVSATRPVYAGKLIANVAAARRPVLIGRQPERPRFC